MWQQLLGRVINGEAKALARAISLVENEIPDYDTLLEHLSFSRHSTIIGITGAPGAGKSTLVDRLIASLVADDKKVGVLCVDPSSPFNMGALLGDRIRMSEWYNHDKVFIRSAATRGSLGGLSSKIIEITAVMQAAGFDYIIVETVGVGQSEIEIAGVADITVVVLVPEGGDEIQTMKSGIMEIADIFVVNKSDRQGADTFLKNLRLMLGPAFNQQEQEIKIIKTVASQNEGISELANEISQFSYSKNIVRRNWLLTDRAYTLISHSKMKGIDKNKLHQEITVMTAEAEFNLYAFVKKYK